MLELIKIQTQEEYKNLFNKINFNYPSQEVSSIIEVLNNINNGCKCSQKRRLNNCDQLIKNYINSLNDQILLFLKTEYKTQNFKFLDLT